MSLYINNNLLLNREISNSDIRRCDYNLREFLEHDTREFYKNLGPEEGRAESIAENVAKIIISMVKEKCSFSLISKVIGKSINEIKEIKKTMM